jgi:primosomal replication protein N
MSKKRPFLSFENARFFSRSINLKSGKEWKEFCKSGNKPDNIPTNPYEVYKKEWISMGDWLGTFSVHTKNFLSFNEARIFARSNNFKNREDWKLYCKSENKPNNIPTNPYEVYNKEWISWGDWLGTKIGFEGFLSFEEARNYVRNLNLKSNKEWYKYCKSGDKPDNIPSTPNKKYKNCGWTNWYDWFGTKIEFEGFLSFEEARNYVRNLNIKSSNDWAKYCKSGNKPNNIPSNPREVYKNEWNDWGDWLGTFTISTQNYVYLSFDDARNFARNLNLKTQTYWRKYCKSGNKPDNIPSDPSKGYKDKGWLSWGDWLGTKIGFNGFLPFEDARNFVRNLNLKTQYEWKVYLNSGNKPNNIPNKPRDVYKDWISMDDWLGTFVISTHKQKFLSFDEARIFVKNLRLIGKDDWYNYCKSGNKPTDIPTTPNTVYSEWVGWGDWLGTYNIASFDKEFLLFNDARNIIRNKNFKNQNEWFEYCKSGNKPKNIPSDPSKTYINDWIDWGDWLGTFTIATQNKQLNYLSEEDFIQFIKDTFPNIPPGIELRKAYEAWWDENKPDYLPKDVAGYYNK